MGCLIAGGWQDYEILDCGDGMKLERWNDVILLRPDPQVIWKPLSPALWEKTDAVYHRSSRGGGSWEFRRKLPEKWTVSYRSLRFYVEPTGFKHTGLFPEQAANWDYITETVQERIRSGRQVRLLNLFGYTGAATVAAACAGASVCHVDAARGMVTRCRENVALSGLEKAPVRYLVDDAFKFVSRELRRGSRYEAIIMDPPSYGRGPGGEVWKLEDSLQAFLEECCRLLSDEPLFFILNSYTTGLSPVVTGNMLNVLLRRRLGGSVEAGDLCLPVSSSRDILLPCGSAARWSAKE